jgi:hypothetical protein
MVEDGRLGQHAGVDRCQQDAGGAVSELVPSQLASNPATSASTRPPLVSRPGNRRIEFGIGKPGFDEA